MQLRKLYSIVALTVLMMLGFLATSLTSYFVAHDSLSRNISEQMLPLTSDNIYSEIQRDLLRPVLISSLMASDTFVRDWVSSGETEPARIQAFLSEIQTTYNTITAFFVSEQTRQYYHPDGVLKTVSPDAEEDAWYFRARAMRQPYEINVDTDTADSSRVSIFINFRVVDRNGNLMGVTGVGLSVTAVISLIDSYQQRYGRTIYFVDREGNVELNGITGPLNRIQERRGISNLSTAILANPSASLSYSAENGETVYVNSRLVPEFDWYLIVEQRSDVAEERIQEALLINAGLALAIMTVVLLIAHFTFKTYQGRLEEMASTDGLTGAANRHIFDAVFEQVVKGAARRGKPVSLVCLDIDHFKRVNDTFGHQAGDLVIRAVVDEIRGQIRDSDTVCRWGGEEFLVLLDECSVTEATEKAEAIREAVKRRSIIFGREQINVTISCGVAEYRAAEQLSSVVGRVDEALYRAKSDGRDRVSVAS